MVRMTERNWIALLVAIALIVPATVAAAQSEPYTTEEPLDWQLQRLDGSALSLADLRGQWVVVNYWATWCAPCREEIPELSHLHADRQDVTVLGLAYEDLAPEAFAEFLAEFDVTYPIILVDVFQPPEPFGAPRVLPTTVIIDPAGRAVKGFAGPVTRAQLEAFIDGVAP